MFIFTCPKNNPSKSVLVDGGWFITDMGSTLINKLFFCSVDRMSKNNIERVMRYCIKTFMKFSTTSLLRLACKQMCTIERN